LVKGEQATEADEGFGGWGLFVEEAVVGEAGEGEGELFAKAPVVFGDVAGGAEGELAAEVEGAGAVVVAQLAVEGDGTQHDNHHRTEGEEGDREEGGGFDGAAGHPEEERLKG